MINISKLNESFITVTCEDRGVLKEIQDEFQFQIPNAKYDPRVKAKLWNGYIKLFNIQKRTFPLGLYQDLIKFCTSREYEYQVIESSSGLPDSKLDISIEDTREFISSLNLHSKNEKITMRYYQEEAIHNCLRNKHSIILSPTASGKSGIIYTIIRYLEKENHNILLIVPIVGLINQMISDFKDYASETSWDADDKVHLIFSGKEKTSDKKITISTWQSLQRQEEEYFKSYTAILIDETHAAKSAQLSKIVEYSCQAEYKLGFTGSLDKSLTHKMVLSGLFGEIVRVASTKELIEQGFLSSIKIKSILLGYSEETCKAVKGSLYIDEVKFLAAHNKRNNFIVNLALSLSGSTLILFNFVEKHGQLLYDIITSKAPDKRVHFVHGKIKSESREIIRKDMQDSDNVITIASVGVFSTGINVPRLNNIIFASPTKSVIRVLQSVGRGLRKAHDKEKFMLYDIGDNLRYKKFRPNYTFDHFRDRLRIYSEEQFPYKIVEVQLEK